MSRTKAPFTIAGVLLIGAAATLAFTQPEKAPADKPPEAAAAEGDATNPGSIHAKLMKLAGSWETATTFEMAGQPATKSKGAVSIAEALDGRFVQETGSGEMEGMPVKDFKMWGYNGGSKKYEAVWTWTLSTGFLYLNGESKDGGKTIQWKAWFDNESGEREDFEATTTFTDDDHFSTKLYGGKLPVGSAGPVMLTEYSRKK